MKSLFLGASALALLPMLATPCFAEAAASGGSDTASLEAVVVTGTRTTGLRAVDSAAPVQVLGGDILKRVGQPDLIQSLAQNIPSVQAQSFGGDASAFNLSFKLRGLSTNHTLVLLNGKRRHGTANVVVSGGPYGGGAGADISLIPVGSIDHVEVLQDGAAAQYGTDAIAGVINIIQKKNTSGGSISVTGGQYQDGGGETGDVMANVGFAPNDKAYLNLTAESKFHGFSFRGDVDPRVLTTGTPGNTSANVLPRFPLLPSAQYYPYVNRIEGDAQYKLNTLTFNAGYAFTPNLEGYAFGSYGHKHGEAYENYRLPTVVSGKMTGDFPFPQGFSPKESIIEDDFAFTAGLKGSVGGWNWDVSSSYGADFDAVWVMNSANASIYKDSSTTTTKGFTPRLFHDGDFETTQWTNTVDLTHSYEVGLAEPLNVAVGAEYRAESYQIYAGDPTSYYGTGAQSFMGYSPANAGMHRRHNYATYVDLAAVPVKGLKLDAAIRYEDYSDFGDTTVAKLTGRYDFNPAFALRGTISSGFRAPTLAEEFYSGINVGPTSVSGVFAPNSPGAKFLGVSGLKAEKSTNFSGGIVTHLAPRLTMTLDVYSIEMTDRIVQSGTLYGYNSNKNVVTSPSVISALTANGVTIDPAIYTLSSGSVGVQTFVNGVNTTTTGADFVATYSTDFGSYGHVDWSLTGNYNVMSIDKVAPPPSNVSASVKLLDPAAISQLKSTTPKFRATFGAFWTLGNLSVSWKESYYGAAHSLAQDPVGAYFDRIEVKPIIITDLEASYQLPLGVKASVGANNLFNNYPTKSPAAYRAGQYLTNASGYASSLYPSFSAFGINGGYYYTRLSWSF